MPARLLSVLRVIFGRSRWERDMSDELDSHLEERVQDLCRSGLSATEARRRARLEFGGIEAYKERCREARGIYWIDETVRNLRYALRSLHRNPGFTAVALVSLTLGIGANIAIFGLLKRLIFSPLPVRNPARLQQVALQSTRKVFYSISFPKFEKLRDNFPLFDGLFGWGGRGEREVVAGERTEKAHITIVTGDYFDVLEVRPALGRLITAGDDRSGGGANVAVLGYGLWQRLFGGDVNVVGKAVKVDQNTLQIIGVVSPDFTGTEPADPADLYIPLHSVEQNSPQLIKGEGAMWMHVMGRLKPGIPLASAQTALHDGWPRFGQERQSMLGDNTEPEFLKLVDGSHGYSFVRMEFSRAVVVLMGLVTVVFLIACANLSTLLFVRGAARTREMTIRMALGAGRSQLIRQWLTESLLLAAGGGCAGLLASRWITVLLLYFVPKANRAYLQPGANFEILAFTAALSIAAGLLFGLFPALRASNVSAEAALRAHALSFSAARGGGARLVLAGQLAASLVLVVGALLFARTLWNLNAASGGFDRKTVVYGDANFRKAGYPRDRAPGVLKEIVERLSRSPQLAVVSLGNPPILYGGPGGWGWVQVPGYNMAPHEDNVVFFYSVGRGYFRTLSIPLLEGRDFEDRDRIPWPTVAAIVNERFARHYFRGRSAVGQKIIFSGRPPVEIIGVVRNSSTSSLREPPPDLVYGPLPPDAIATIVARTRPGVDASAGESEIRAAVAAVDKNIPVKTDRLEVAVQESLSRDRLVAELSAGFGLLGVLLASIGLYGAIAHSVSGRTREIGVRIALGADPWTIMRMVFRQSLAVTGLGIVVGLPLAIGGAKSIESLLFGISAADPVTLVGSVVLLGSVGLLAGMWPARRAARLDPTRALRYE